MSSLLVIRLHPVEPVAAEVFTGYLEDLKITAYELSYDDPDGSEAVGSSAEYVPPTDELPNIVGGGEDVAPPVRRSYPEGATNCGIIQHLTFTKLIEDGEHVRDELTGEYGWMPNLSSVATAVIEILDPPEGGEHITADVRLEITRTVVGEDGEETVTEFIHKQVYYNVSLADRELPDDPNEFPGITDDAGNPFISLYLALPPPGEQSSANEILPEDGTAPNYANLLDAVGRVLENEPGDADPRHIADLTYEYEQCRHVAREIIWDREAYPLPIPKTNLEVMYTGTHDDNSAETRDRRTFEGNLLTYYVEHNNEAERLAGFVFALSAAIWCEQQTQNATQAGFYFPVFPDAPGRDVKVILSGPGGGTLEPEFEVPAEYFYALAASLPHQVKQEQRLKMAKTASEAQTISIIEEAFDDQVLTTEPGEDGLRTLENNELVNPFQAARRLRALGLVGEAGTPVYEVTQHSPAEVLIQDWLHVTNSDINKFWKGELAELDPPGPTPDEAGHLDLLLRVITKGHQPLEIASRDPAFNVLLSGLECANEAVTFGVSNVAELAEKNSCEWSALLALEPEPTDNIWLAYPSLELDEDKPVSLLPDFTKPGTADERFEAFILYLRKFFAVASIPPPLQTPAEGAIPGLIRPDNPLDRLASTYNASDPPFSFADFDEGIVQDIVERIFPDDSATQNQFIEWLGCIQSVVGLVADIDDAIDDYLRFSVIEALWARGFNNSDRVAQLSLEDFKNALVGTVAYDFAETIWETAGASATTPTTEEFSSINPNGTLVNCVPPAHLSPLGPVAYLNELLRLSELSTCENPLDQSKEVAFFLSDDQTGRGGVGPLGDLLATKANLEVPLPLIDLVNESLEYMVANNVRSRAIYNTAGDQVGGHELTSNATPTEGAYLHDPETLLEALPEHSTPATPVDAQLAYETLKNDFSACNLPYSQPLDVSRTYLQQLGTSRFATMRHFRRYITEFVLEPEGEPAGFQKHLWRYPVRIETAIEYLGITPEEYRAFLQLPTAEEPSSTEAPLLRELFGFPPPDPNRDEPVWSEVVVLVSEFMERTCLTYCEFLELWRSGFVEFTVNDITAEEASDCEPCCLENYRIQFTEERFPSLARLIVFIRLWRKLQAVPNAAYTFTELRDICEVIGLFEQAEGVDVVNQDFIRQLAAFQMLRDDFGLSLFDPAAPPEEGDTGTTRMHLLALWEERESPQRNWAIDHLLDQIQQYAMNVYGCGCREPEFIKLLEANLDPLSALVGFNPENSEDRWHAKPTHTLRFAEILEKIYTSEFTVGELLFLFTSDTHLQGDDPFPLQTTNEAKDSPLGLPDDEDQYSLWALRNKLLAVEVGAEDAEQWSWSGMETALREEFGFAPTHEKNRWLSLGQHFFPTVLADSGIPVQPADQRYSVSLGAANTSKLMWNTPPDGPFHFDDADSYNTQLFAQIPLTDEAVLAKLGRIRQLSDLEQNAVRDLYFMPRVDLADFAFIFDNFGEAEECLIQEPDEAKRWAWFQIQFAQFHQRCQIIAEHLAEHTNDAASKDNPEGTELAKLLMKHLWADENMADGDWENDNGVAPDVTWPSQPKGGAFAALLGLTGTGMETEYYDTAEALRWREVRGGVDAFGPEENAWNAPIPTILPSMAFSFSDEQLRFAAVRNGFAMANTDGAMLGGAEPFILRWKGLLLIEKEGQYCFSAGSPTPAGEVPDFEKVDQWHRWRVILKQGQETWVLLAHDWPDEEAPADRAKLLELERGFYELEIELERKAMFFDGPEDVCPHVTGFQLKYKGPDADMEWLAIPNNKLFQERKNATLSENIQFSGAAKEFLAGHYTSTVRDIRRTYQRVFKTMLLANRFDLSTRPIADDGQSELGYILSHPLQFAGQAYYRSGEGFVTHKAFFDPNFLPILDNYASPSVVQDHRVDPTAQRRQAMFDWWERLFDYAVMRRETQRSPEQPAWLLFHEAAETHTDEPAHLLRHLGVDLRHDTIVLQYFDAEVDDLSFDVSSPYLEDDRWAVRVWQSEKWVRALLEHFYPKDITTAHVFLWVSDGPKMDGNTNLTRFYRDGCIENGDPRRYEEINRINDGLRERGRAALVAYLTRLNRVPLPWATDEFATEAKHLSELLLIDVEAGICQKASRIEEAISAVQLFIQRARLGLEPVFEVLPDFLLAWERNFASFRNWEAYKRRLIYRENWIEWEELQEARQTEAFQFLESELRRAALTMPVPGGLAYWDGLRPPAHPGVSLLQHREPATIRPLPDPPSGGLPQADGLDLMGTPDRHARPSWLAPSKESEVPSITHNAELPMWLQAAVRLGAKFIRVAAAGTPPATTTFEPKCGTSKSVYCEECEKVHPALMDEYYFWIEDSRHYREQDQIAEWGAYAEGNSDDPQTDWHRPDRLPRLLRWDSKPMVHLRWCRVHNGEFQQPRQSNEGVWIDDQAEGTAQLVFLGRSSDSLQFEIRNGEAPEGWDSSSMPGFRYDLATDEAVRLPDRPLHLETDEEEPVEPPSFGGLAAFPFFAWFDPGAPLLPPSPFSPAVAVARHLRAHWRFEAALKWYETVYNPLMKDNTWLDCLKAPEGAATYSDECCCASEPVTDAEVRERAILLHYLETLVQWGDALMRKNTPEAFQQARLAFDTAAKILGLTPITVLNQDEQDDQTEAPSVTELETECAPLNTRLMWLYTSVNDRLSLIHACLNARRLKNGQPNVDMPYFGNSKIRDCWKITTEFCIDEYDWCLTQSPYRFLVLVQKAKEVADDVRGLGAALLAAYEKGDAEYLVSLRTMHERQLLNLMLEVRQSQWREADWQIQALEKSKQIAQTRLLYYNNLIANELIGGEASYESLITSSTTLRATGNIVEAIGQAMNLIPDPHVGFPSNFVELPVGSKLSAIFSASGQIVNVVADIISATASLGLTTAGWERREDEWEHQCDVLTIEIEQIERQILAAERRRDIALRELNNHQQQIENAAEVQDFLRDKFTNHALYLWMQQETAAIYYQMYEMALHFARQAQRAFNFERGYTTRQFIPAEIWDNLHEGLLAGERLQLAIQHIEQAYYCENVREYELSKHVSLRSHFPMAFLQLQLTGYCEIEIPEWMFDLDYPGHYMRRIKNVTMTIPCVVGPYTGVHCRLTLLSSKTRVDPRLVDPSHTCCQGSDCENGYPAKPDDPRMVSMYAATEAIATSRGQNDSGMFELNFRDERYLPFEFSGAVSRWRIELPLENNHFDMESLSDLILHLNFTAREGGDELRKVANECAQQNLPGAGIRFFDVRRDLPEAWQLLNNPVSSEAESKQLGVRLSRNMFPYLTGNKKIGVSQLQIFFDAPGADPSAHHIVEFLVGQQAYQIKEEKCDCDMYSIACIADANWPGLFHGVLEIDFEALSTSGFQDLGVFRFPKDVGEITDTYLFCGYKML